jgi:tRNA(Ile2) C34 agmatinyltransferase TiaS
MPEVPTKARLEHDWAPECPYCNRTSTINALFESGNKCTHCGETFRWEQLQPVVRFASWKVKE